MPEKNLNEISRPARDMFEKGKTAMQRNNLDYAIMHFQQVLLTEPGFYDCRAALRAAQFKRAGASTGFMKKFFGTASSQPALAKAQIAMRKDPLDAFPVLEQVLDSDPNNTGAHKLIAEAAEAADFPKTALISLEILVKQNPKDRPTKIRLAALYSKLNQIPKAEAIYNELLKANPNDAEVAQAYKNLTARKTMDEGGYDALADGKGSYRDILKDKQEAVTLEQENRVVKSDDRAAELITEYQERLQREPNNLKLLRNLAEMHIQRKEFDQGLDYYNRIRATEGGSDPSLEKAIADAELKRFDHRLSQLDPNSPEYSALADKIQAEKFTYQLDECKQRAEKYPTDLLIRFELGVLLLQANKVGEAIREFQQAQMNPQKRLQAMGNLAQCFFRRGMYDMAAAKLNEALKEKLVLDDEKKDLIYNLGLVLEKQNKRAEAIEQFKIIYAVDIDYRDVAAKVDSYYSDQSGGTA